MPSTLRVVAAALIVIAAQSARAEEHSSQHVPPAPPASSMPDMPYHDMVAMMGMDDASRMGMVQVDRFEWRDAKDTNAAAWDARAWYGSDYDKLWFRTEGERVHGRTEDARVELLWDHVFARWWSLQAGARQDFGAGPPRNWAAMGVQGLAPQWFAIDASLYIGDAGRTAARFQATYELLFTQRLILEPELELNLYGRSDVERGLGSGLSDLELGLRLRYEIRREFAPYIGIVWNRAFGDTADFRRADGEDASDLRAVAGVKVWF